LAKSTRNTSVLDTQSDWFQPTFIDSSPKFLQPLPAPQIHWHECQQCT